MRFFKTCLLFLLAVGTTVSAQAETLPTEQKAISYNAELTVGAAIYNISLSALDGQEGDLELVGDNNTTHRVTILFQEVEGVGVKASHRIYEKDSDGTWKEFATPSLIMEEGTEAEFSAPAANGVQVNLKASFQYVAIRGVKPNGTKTYAKAIRSAPVVASAA